jgi:hypothetical protein
MISATGIFAMADCGFEIKQNSKRYSKASPLLTILPEGPRKKFL